MKHINTNAPVQSTSSILINAHLKKVWTILTDINNWPTWNTDILRAKIDGPLHSGTSFDWKSGGVAIHSTLHTVEPHTHFGWYGKALGINGINNWTLHSVDGKTQVSVAESMEGPLPSLLKKWLNKTLQKQMQRWLAALRVECEK